MAAVRQRPAGMCLVQACGVPEQRAALTGPAHRAAGDSIRWVMPPNLPPAAAAGNRLSAPGETSW